MKHAFYYTVSAVAKMFEQIKNTDGFISVHKYLNTLEEFTS